MILPQAYETHGYEEEVRPQACYQSNKISFMHFFFSVKALDLHGAEWHEDEVWPQVSLIKQHMDTWHFMSHAGI